MVWNFCHVSTHSCKHLNPRFLSIQKDDHLLVWMKRGSRDMAPYYLSLALCGVGMVLVVKNLIAMSFPKKKAD
jgi:coproporphyrinogen III oxidase